MRVEIRPNGDGAYDLVVDGKTKMEGESFTVCNNVRAGLESGGVGTREADEVAAAILADMRGDQIDEYQK